MMQYFVHHFDDLLLLAGCACILYGVSLWNVIATWLTAGVMLIGFGVMIGKAKANVIPE